jgi:hypothetical protein
MIFHHRLPRRTPLPTVAPHPYVRHRPELTLLYQVVEYHLPEFREHLRQHDKYLPRFVIQEFEDYLHCGRLEQGFVRVKCTGCRHELLVAFSCKCRGFCPFLRGSPHDPDFRTPHRPRAFALQTHDISVCLRFGGTLRVIASRFSAPGRTSMSSGPFWSISSNEPDLPHRLGWRHRPDLKPISWPLPELSTRSIRTSCVIENPPSDLPAQPVRNLPPVREDLHPLAASRSFDEPEDYLRYSLTSVNIPVISPILGSPLKTVEPDGIEPSTPTMP